MLEQVAKLEKLIKVRMFFLERSFTYGALVERAPEGVPQDSVYEAMEMVYDRRMNGEDIPRIRLAREVWVVARQLQHPRVPPPKKVESPSWRIAFYFATVTTAMFFGLFLYTWLGVK